MTIQDPGDAIMRGPSTIREMDWKEYRGYRVGQLVQVAIGSLLHPWRDVQCLSTGVITGFFVVSGSVVSVRGAPYASTTVGAHVLIGNEQHKYHITYLNPVEVEVTSGRLETYEMETNRNDGDGADYE